MYNWKKYIQYIHFFNYLYIIDLIKNVGKYYNVIEYKPIV